MPILLILVLILSAFPTSIVKAQDNHWWDCNWLLSRRLTFNNSASSEDLVNFPILVNLSSSNIDWGSVQSDGDDIWFVDQDNSTVLDWEIEYWNYTAQEALIWVEVPQIDMGSTTDHIFMYYNNSEALNNEDMEGTWDDNFKLVTHMRDDPDASHIKDSTVNANDGTKLVANEPTEAEGIIGKAQDFDGSDDRIDVPDSASLDVDTAITITGWFKHETGLEAEAGEFFGGMEKNNAYRLAWQGWTDGWEVDVYLSGVRKYSISTDTYALAGVWYYVTGVYDPPDLEIYVDGDLEFTIDIGTDNIDNSSLDFRIGLGWDKIWNGTIDEVRISDIARSDAWIKAQYLSMTDQLITFSAPMEMILELFISVVDSSTNPISGAYVNLYAQSDGTLNFTEITDSEGEIPKKIMDEGNYTLLVTAEDYQTYNHIFYMNQTTILEIPLIELTGESTINILGIILGLFTILAFGLSRRRR